MAKQKQQWYNNDNATHALLVLKKNGYCRHVAHIKRIIFMKASHNSLSQLPLQISMDFQEIRYEV